MPRAQEGEAMYSPRVQACRGNQGWTLHVRASILRIFIPVSHVKFDILLPMWPLIPEAFCNVPKDDFYDHKGWRQFLGCLHTSTTRWTLLGPSLHSDEFECP
ncbi:hypothetical protein K7X08_002578 [Anisodus acutangulus]|uniref:Uncharacterized protein n=1 Tax=Anisodus acutangulus TaxID=402998 RepID=A0A9Q1R6F0_9SOLA|nr:hypothetical protein K7X08_002578 [Anisodus acutangulus]